MNPFTKILYFFCSSCRPNRSRTVRYAFPIVFSALALLGALTVTSTNKSFIHIESTKTSVRAGESFQIGVYVSAHVPINAVDIKLDFPQSQVKVLGIDTGESVITIWTKDPYVKNNTVYLSGGTFRKGFLGDHLIATINAKAIDTGLAHFLVSDALLLAGDGSGTKVDAVKNGAQEAKLYIANTDGTLTPSTLDGGSSISANVEIRIVTDIDGDGVVTLNDISRFMSAWFSKSVIFDFSGDGKMTFRDFGIILADSFRR